VIDLDARWGAGFQDAEAGLYAVALRDAAGNLPTTSYSLAGDALKLNFTAAYEVIEVTLVRLHDGITPDLIGTPGPDTLRAGRDGQSLRGLGGDDLLIGNAGVDLIRGDDGDDEIRGGGGNDELWGGNGDDRIQGQAGRDTVLGEEGNDRIWGGGGDDVIGGGGGTDRLFGSNGHDILNGDGGADILRGAKGNDILSGGARDDILDGGKGQDRLTGGAGADLFVFAPGDGSDEITDFSVADGDRIDLGQLALGLSYGEFRDQHLAQTGTGVTIQVDAGLSVLLTGVQIADLTAEAFLLA
jgi:Ca2+-binding RTX toxin-like protein